MYDATDLYKYEIIHLNIRGARANKSNLTQYLNDSYLPEIITLNETKLGSSTRFEVEGYYCAARKETSCQGGSHGSLILVRSDITDVVEIEEVKQQFRNEEIIGIEIKATRKRPRMKIFTHYIPPDTYPNSQVFQFIQRQGGNCILTGDLNCKNQSWGSTKTDRYGEELQNIINQNGLFILNDGSKTRCDPVSGKEEVLDLCLSNYDSLSIFKDFWVGDEIGSDHYPLHVKTQFRDKPLSAPPTQERRFENANWKKFEQHLLSKPMHSQCQTSEHIDDLVTRITEEITDAYEISCPLKNKRKAAKTSFSPEIKIRVKEKRRLRREKNLAFAEQDFVKVREIMTKINRLGNEIKRIQKFQKIRDIERHCENLNKQNDPKKFFQTFKKLSDPILNTEPKPLRTQTVHDEWGNSAKTAQEKAELFAKRLEKVHQEPNFHGFNDGWKASVESYLRENKTIYETNPLQQYLETENGDESPLVQRVTIEELRKNLSRCKNKSAVGQDGLSYRLLKKVPDAYLERICSLFSQCLHIGFFPSKWKKAKTILIPKPGKDIKQAKNYRPISLLSCLGKLLERIIAFRLSTHLELKNQFAKSQSGFRAGHMTSEQLFRLAEECHISFKKQQVVTALFLDAEAAFDKCWYSGIRYKLKVNHNLPNRLIRTISSFLTDRSLQVCYEGCWSEDIYLKAGTPQGSPLSPLIYLIYVNDFPSEIQKFCNISQFADDSALWSHAYTVSYAISKLQKGLNCLEGWCRRWRVKLNGEKSKLVFFNRLNGQSDENYKIHLFNDIISPENQARFLGVDFDSRLKFSHHISDVCGRANKRLNVLRALSRYGTKPNIMIRLYKTYIRPLLEYGSIAFIAAPDEHMNRLQVIQNAALRLCLRLPSYIRIDLLHEYSGIETVKKRMKNLNTKLLQTMARNNQDVKNIMSNYLSHLKDYHKSPLDIISDSS